MVNLKAHSRLQRDDDFYQEASRESRRDFLNILAVSTGAVGSGAFLWTAIDSMNPSKDVLALASIEVD